MAKNVIIMIGDGMGWEMARAAAIQQQINEGATGDTLSDFYLDGKGTGLSFQELDGYSLVTTSNTFIDGDKGNSALQGDPFNHVTGTAPEREGFEFDPSPALVEGFFPSVRDSDGFDEDPYFEQAIAELNLGNFTIGFDASRVSDTTSGFFVADTLSVNAPLFDISNPEILTLEDGQLVIDSADLLVSPELAGVLGDEELTGADVGDARIDALVSGDSAGFTVESGTTSVALDAALLKDAADLSLVGADSEGTPASDEFQVGFEITEATDFTFTLENGITPLSGAITHTGSVSFERFTDVGEPLGGNLPFYDVNQGPSLPWERIGQTIDGTDGEFDIEYVKNLYPDSAGTATALYSGEKTYVGAIGVEIHEHDLQTLGEIARDLGKSFGAVSSVPFNHATPAAAISHVNQRNKNTEESVGVEVDDFGDIVPDSDNILYQILNETKPELVLGAGHTDTRGGDGRYLDQTTLDELRDGVYADDFTFLERGENASQTLLETAATLNVNEGDRLFGVYGALGQGGNLPWRTANGDYSNTGFSSRTDSTRPLADGQTAEEFIAQEVNYNATLMDMTTAALDVLGDDPDGFWVTIEGGDIDWSMHDNSLDNAIGTTLDFAESVEIVQDWIAENGGYEENLLIVTADHDHYLTLNDDFPRLLREFGAEALTTEVDNESGLAIVDVNVDENGTPILDANGNEVSVKRDNTDAAASGHFWGSDPNVKYGWGTHTTIPVPVYYEGAGAEELDALVGEGFTSYGNDIPGLPGYVDQTHIAQVQALALTETENYINGYEADETLIGTDADDLIMARVGSDRATGGVGDDVIFGGEGRDVIKGDFNLYSGNDGNDVVFGGDGNDKILGGAGDDQLYGQDGNDQIAGSAGNDLLFGGEGNDRLVGRGGADQLFGETGDDNLFGGAKDDILTGGLGDDMLTGGKGSDLFVLEMGAGMDQIMDFVLGEDTIGLMGGLTFGQLSITEENGNAMIAAGDDMLATVMNTSASSLIESAFAVA